jgi:hypothetical protein
MGGAGSRVPIETADVALMADDAYFPAVGSETGVFPPQSTIAEGDMNRYRSRSEASCPGLDWKPRIGE